MVRNFRHKIKATGKFIYTQNRGRKFILVSIFLLLFVGVVGAGDETWINSKLQSHAGGTYKLPAGTFEIEDTIYIPDGTTLEGTVKNGKLLSKIILVDDAGWPSKKAMIEVENTKQKNIVIRNFEIDGNCENQDEIYGKGYHDMIMLSHPYNVEIYGMYLHDGLSDGIRIHHDYTNEYATVPTNIKIHDNVIFESGHDGIWIKHSSSVDIYDNEITLKGNSGIRLTECSNVQIYDNDISSNNRGFAGIELDKGASSTSMENIEIYNNNLHDLRCWGIWLYGYYKNGAGYDSDQINNIHIHDNSILRCGRSENSYQYREAGGIIIQGFNALIEDNIIDDNAKFGVAFEYWSYSKLGESYKPPAGEKFTVILKNNNIRNTVKSEYPKDKQGYGVANILDSNHVFVLKGNTVSGSEIGRAHV